MIFIQVELLRFSPEELATLLKHIEQKLPRNYSIAYYYADKRMLDVICKHGTPSERFCKGVPVCFESPIELGWFSESAVTFRKRALLSMKRGEVTTCNALVAILLGVPSFFVDSDGLVIPELLCARPSGRKSDGTRSHMFYSKEHILKIYDLETTPQASSTSS